jgi:hypothetical protein
MKNEATLNFARTVICSVIHPVIHPNKEVSLGKKSLDSTAASNRFQNKLQRKNCRVCEE